jgi:chorismate mutase
MASSAELAALRAAIDVCNLRLVDVLHQRAALVRAAAACKRQQGLPIADPQREAAMLAALQQLARPDGCDAAMLREVLQAVFAASRGLAER